MHAIAEVNGHLADILEPALHDQLEADLVPNGQRIVAETILGFMESIGDTKLE